VDDPAVNVYGATETSGIAADCDRHAGMHLFEDLVITEIVDEHHRPVPPGTFGAKVLVTVLFSRTLPLIRYEMSDSVVPAMDQRCGCGKPYRLLVAVQGREQDALRLPGLDGAASRVVQPVVFHHVMDDVAAAGWQIAQREDGHLDVLLARPREVDTEALATRLRSALTARGAVAPAVRIQTVDAIPRTPLGKAPLIVGPTTSIPP
jgi:phenylacetate-coenzyme A ligase PaaK-like adenylate-forming protein